jgi:hypothetical protein
MLASDFITSRERLVKAYARNIITCDQYEAGMHALFCQAQVSHGREDDNLKASEIYACYVKAGAA